jgi:hypothetical protein
MNEVYRAYVCNRVIAIIDDGSEEIVCDVLGKDSSLGAASRTAPRIRLQHRRKMDIHERRLDVAPDEEYLPELPS